MVDTKIKDLTAKTTVVATDEIVINDVAGGNLDKKEGLDDIKTFMSNSPTLVTPALGTPASGVATNLTGTSGITGLGTLTTDLLLGGNKLNLSGITLQEVSNVAEMTIVDNTAGAGIKIQNTDGSFSLTNGTSGTDNFLPTFLGVAKGSTRPGLFFVGEIPIISDAGSVALIRFDARRIGPASILTRPLFQITNSGAVKWEMDRDGNIDQKGNNLTNGGVIFLTEQAEADTNVAGKGQIWVDTATPNILKFTDDADTDFTIAELEGSQSFTGIKTFSALTSLSGGLDLVGTNADNIQNLIHDQSVSGTDIDFVEDEVQTISIAANTTFTTANRATGKSKTLKIVTDATLRTLTFPAWKFIGTKPADQAASKTGVLTVTCFGTADTDIVAAYAVEV